MKHKLKYRFYRLIWLVRVRLSVFLYELAEKVGGQSRYNVSQLRQWLNEERITDKKLVTNKEIETWLEI